MEEAKILHFGKSTRMYAQQDFLFDFCLRSKFFLDCFHGWKVEDEVKKNLIWRVYNKINVSLLSNGSNLFCMSNWSKNTTT